MDKRFRDFQILGKILAEIEFLETYVRDLTLDIVLNSEEKKRTISMTFLNIGELANNLSTEFIKSETGIPFSLIINTRHRVAHGYHKLKFEVIWETIKRDIPELKNQVEKILEG